MDDSRLGEVVKKIERLIYRDLFSEKAVIRLREVYPEMKFVWLHGIITVEAPDGRLLAIATL